ncbi:nitroreductase [Solidesulfovibrio fructosivorans JJ]]|uniref:Nitroreductase n=1 Tax=Solidesulfovibrio fructosivorans JJ] TaxID=596151 RepID=E1K0D5_SOLFR|nr:nitroreductase family protein [Solidesulfovibrio fructosivorans]EFL49966.1 nitroreductase [Solidesulfovibrio fructosivorans JJ]]
MDLFEAIHTRRSIRAFTDAPVSETDMDAILRAAMAAPSAGNEQPWHFVAITDREVLDAIPSVHPYAAMVKTAPLAIVVAAEHALEKYPGNWVLDCSAAVENLMLAARGLGIGSVWCGLYPQADRMEGMATLLGLPEGVSAHALVVLGHPSPDFKRVDRFKPERIHRNRW